MYHTRPIKSQSIVFLGDSLTEAFDLDHYFQDEWIVNRGISGDTTLQVDYRLGEILAGKPQKLFLMIGINDLFNDDPYHVVFNNISNIMVRIMSETPATELFVQSILPVREDSFIIEEDLNTKVYKTNDLLRSYCKEQHAHFLDLHAHFLDRQGQMDAAYTYDGAHLTPKGYDLWAELVAESAKR